MTLAPVHTARVDQNAASAYAVTRLTLSDFRCYAGLRLELGTETVVLTGANGAGKTNLLEAVSLLSPGRGLRRAKLGDMVRRHASSNSFAIHARIAAADFGCEIGTGLLRDDTTEGAERRSVKIDGVVHAGPQALAEATSVVWLTPQMDRLFVDGPAGRRRFLDRLTFGLDPAHARRVNAFEKAMRERNRILKTGAGDAAWLTAIEGTMAEWAIAVAAARRDALVRLSAALADAPAGSFPQAHLAVEGALEAWLDEMPAVAVEDRYRSLLAERRRIDAEAGGATEGPHRSDLRVRHAGKDMPAEQCSTGEQKALLIGIVLADARLQAAKRGIAPLLLLDEVAAHLDEARREALFAQIAEIGAQAWMTGTEPGLFGPLSRAAQFFVVRDGRVFG